MRAARSPLDADLAQRTLAVVMAGGNGTRLGDLTRWHCKPALPFGGQYRNIDFPLSNCINSGIRRVALATQYKAHSLIQHVQLGWSFLRPEVGEFVEVWPAQQRCGKGWYAGTADAIRQNLDLVDAHAPDYVLILAGDHVYKMDYLAMIEAHAASRARVTVGCVEVPIELASSFGVMQSDRTGRVTGFDEKPLMPRGTPGNPDVALASMGIYVFDKAHLFECLARDGASLGSGHDFGHDVLPALIDAGGVFAHPFRDPRTARQGYWRDVGTTASYWEANMDLLDEPPPLDLHDPAWPLWTHQPQLPPPLFTGAGTALRSIVSPGCRIGGRVERAVLSQGCTVGPGAVVEEAVLHSNVSIGRDCRVHHAIVEDGCSIPDGCVVGPDSFDEIAAAASGETSIALVTQAVIDELESRRKVA